MRFINLTTTNTNNSSDKDNNNNSKHVSGSGDQVALISQCPTATVSKKSVAMRSERLSTDLQSQRYQTDAGLVEQSLR